MTILPPPRPRPRHECVPPDNPYTITRPFSALAAAGITDWAPQPGALF